MSARKEGLAQGKVVVLVASPHGQGNLRKEMLLFDMPIALSENEIDQCGIFKNTP